MNRENPGESYYYILEALQNAFEFVFKCVLYIELVLQGACYSWACFVLLGALVLRIILINSLADEVKTPSALIKTCIRIFGCSLICSILFKLDGLSDFSWDSTFWYL